MDRYCPLPFMHIFNDSTNQYDICCHVNTKSTESKQLRNNWNLTRDLPFDFLFSDDMQAIRDKVNNNEYVDACKLCYEMDELNVPSPRKTHVKRYGRPKTIGQVEIKLRMFGNYCNLSCYMCHPNHSTGRQNDLKSHGYDLADFGYAVKPERHNKISYEKMESHILNNLQYIDKMIILGGEPLLVKRFYEFLDKIPDEHTSRIYISVCTNLTKIEFKGHKLKDYIKRFKKLTLNVSADHFMEKEEWIRWPIDFNEFEDNLDYINEVFKKRQEIDVNDVMVTPTVSVLNVDDLEDIFNFYRTKSVFVGNFSMQYVTYPLHVQPHLHIDVERIIEKYIGTEFEPIAIRMKDKLEQSSDDEISIQRKRLIEYLDRLSTLRGNWKKIWSTI